MEEKTKEEKGKIRVLGRTLAYYALVIVTTMLNINVRNKSLVWFANMFTLIVTLCFFLLLLRDYKLINP